MLRLATEFFRKPTGVRGGERVCERARPAGGRIVGHRVSYVRLSTLVAVVYIRNTLRHRGVAKPGRAKGRVVWEGEDDAASNGAL